jgi:DNA-binding NarL/FixJ family response regulator
MQRILLADDHHIVRQGFRALLERGGFEVIAEAEDGVEAVQLAETHRPDVAVLDLGMPRLGGMDCARQILARDAHSAIVFLTVHSEEHQVVEALRIGVRGYVVKLQATSELIQAIREVHAGGVYLSPRVSRVLVNAYLAGSAASPDPLTARQREVLRLVAEGKTTREVAAAIGVSVKTAELYRARIMTKLDIHDTAGLVRYAIRCGLIGA